MDNTKRILNWIHSWQFYLIFNQQKTENWIKKNEEKIITISIQFVIS